MNSKEAQFFAELLATFKVEAEEHIKSLSDSLLLIEKKQPEAKEKELIDTMFREAHNLKGAARSVSLDIIQMICQSLEDVLDLWKTKKIKPNKTLFDTLYATFDWIGKCTSAPSEPNPDKSGLDDLIQRLESFKQPESAELLHTMIEKQQEASPPAPIPIPQAQSKPTPAPIPQEQPKPAPHQEKGKTIRVYADKLDQVLQQVEEMLILKITANQRVSDFKGLQNTVDEWMKSGSQESDFKGIRDQMRKMEKHIAQDSRTATSLIDTLLEETKKVLMQPFSTLLEAFPRMARDISQSVNKEVELEIQGGEIEIDRRILEEIKDPLIHLIRNSIDHGIESREERLKRQKPAKGLIKISANQTSGNSIELIVEDDGGGIDVQAVKNAAVKKGIVGSKEVEMMKDEEAIMLIFHSGVSTSPIITEVSGRGIGMEIVSEKVEKLGGKVSIETESKKGTKFLLTLPATMSTFHGIHIQAAGKDFIIPTHSVKRIMRIKQEDIKTVENQETIHVDGKTLSLVSLAHLLGISNSKARKEGYLLILILKISEVTVAFEIDQVFKEQEVFVKSLGKQLARVKNVAGATIMEWGRVVPILDAFDLIKSVTLAGGVKRAFEPEVETKKKRYTVLIVEDSVTARMLLKNILESAGYDVKIAVDGAEGFSMLKTESIDLLLSDIEMPRMDGFQLTEEVRKTESLKDIPIILCTSRGSKEDREHGIAVGANAYITKSSFTQSNLLDIMKNLLD